MVRNISIGLTIITDSSLRLLCKEEQKRKKLVLK